MKKYNYHDILMMWENIKKYAVCSLQDWINTNFYKIGGDYYRI